MPDGTSQPDPKKRRGATRKTFSLRLAPELYRDLEAWAEQEMRSVNGQIEFLLRQAIHHRKKSEKGRRSDL